MKKIIALLLALTMVFALVACASTEKPAETPADNQETEKPAEQPEETPAEQPEETPAEQPEETPAATGSVYYLNFKPEADEGAAEEPKQGPNCEYLYEPSEESLLGVILPQYIKVQIFRGMLDTSASENAARMTAMDNATRNCNDLIRSLTLLYNKTRQS